MSNKQVLITDGHRRQSIVVTRNLGRHGVEVTVGSDGWVCPAGRSNYATRRIRYPSPAEDDAGFVAAIERELRSRSYDAFIPVTSPTVEHVLGHRDRLERLAPIPYQPLERLRDGLDKTRTIAAAREAGVPVPRTLTPETLDPDTVEETLGYPVVVKPARASGSEGVAVCQSRDELVAAFRASREQFGPTLVQEYVPNGGEIGVYTLYDWAGELVGLTVQRRLRTNPPEGGPSTLRETIEAPALVALADSLLSEMEWRGLAMAEFRVDERTGEPKLLEVNPRFWGSLALSVSAGVAFPHLLYRLATEGNCEPALEYRVGVEARNLLGDVGHLLRRQDRLAALPDFLAPAERPRAYDVFSRTDPLPALGFTARAVSDSLGRALSSR